MDSFQTFIVLMFAATILVGISQKLHIAYPIALVLAGAAIGFNPSVRAVSFDPNLILVIVLPPILYYAAFGISLREFKRNLQEILSLALGLVVFTTLVIGVIFKWIFPEFPWAIAFAFGAIVSPPDAIAATTILKRFAISTRLLTVLEGESLINDASAIVLYRLAVVALLSGTFSLSEASVHFVTTVSGGIVVGFILGYLIQSFSRRFLEPIVGVVFSFTIPYITYILADSLGFSGVLAVVVNGLMGSQVLLRHHSSLRRILGYAAWDIFIILMNCFVFILIGLQLRSLTTEMTMRQMLLYSAYAFAITCAMILVRMIWVYAKSSIHYLKAQKKPKAPTLCPQILREAALLGWSGMRGIVSLAAALALPYTLTNGMPLEGRSEVIFITFIVILLTLLIPGLTLSPLIRWLKIHQQTEHHDAHRVRKQLVVVAEETINQMHSIKQINDREYDFLTTYFNLQRNVLEITTSPHKKWQSLESARSMVIQEQRKKLVEIWERLEIDDKLLNQLEHELDLEETRMTRAELK
jgi:Na+/H+ antiporter